MTVIDFILLLVLIIIIFVGFSVGIIKMASVILGMYLALQVAALLYIPFASLTGGTVSSQDVWFGILWGVWTIIFTLIVLSFTRYIQLPQWLAGIEQLAGMVLGLIAGIFGLLVLGFVFQNTITVGLAGSGCNGGFLRFFAQQFNGSLLMHVFNTIKIVLLNYLSPWLPSNNLPVFQDQSALVRSCGL